MLPGRQNLPVESTEFGSEARLQVTAEHLAFAKKLQKQIDMMLQCIFVPGKKDDLRCSDDLVSSYIFSDTDLYTGRRNQRPWIPLVRDVDDPRMRLGAPSARPLLPGPFTLASDGFLWAVTMDFPAALGIKATNWTKPRRQYCVPNRQLISQADLTKSIPALPGIDQGDHHTVALIDPRKVLFQIANPALLNPHQCFESRGGNGSFPGDTVSLSRMRPSRPWITASPPPPLARMSLALASASDCRS